MNNKEDMKKKKVRHSNISELLDNFVEVGKDGYLIKIDPSKKKPRLVFGVCGNGFSLFDLKDDTIRFIESQ